MRKLYVKTESYNLWWGIYGICNKTGWEDLDVYDENDNKLVSFCLNTKDYLREAVEELKDDPEEAEFLEALERYLTDNEIYYWYYYKTQNSENFYEVEYSAPINEDGIKPSFTDLWHPDEGIGLSTIKTAVQAFIKKHFSFDCEVDIICNISLEEAWKAYNEHFKNRPLEVSFADELVSELSEYWKKPKEDVLQILKSSAK